MFATIQPKEVAHKANHPTLEFVIAAIGVITKTAKGRRNMKLEDLKFRYYNGEKECPNDIPVNFWSIEKYLAEHIESGEFDDFKAKYEADVSDDVFSAKELHGGWDNPFHFLANANVSDIEKFTAYCCRRADDFTAPTGYDSYFNKAVD